MYGIVNCSRASSYWRHHPIQFQKYQNPRRGGTWWTHTQYKAVRRRRGGSALSPNLPQFDGMVRGVSTRRTRRRKYPLRQLEKGTPSELWKNFTKLAFRRQCCKQTRSRVAHGFVRRNKQVAQGHCSFAKRAAVAAPHFCVSRVGGNESKTPLIFRSTHWTLVAPYLTPLELVRLSHTHKLQVPDICWQQTWTSGKVPCYRTACQVCYLVDKFDACMLARSILTERAAVRAFVALWQLGHTEACIELARFPRVHRLIVTRYRREKIRRNLNLY